MYPHAGGRVFAQALLDRLRVFAESGVQWRQVEAPGKSAIQPLRLASGTV